MTRDTILVANFGGTRIVVAVVERHRDVGLDSLHARDPKFGCRFKRTHLAENRPVGDSGPRRADADAVAGVGTVAVKLVSTPAVSAGR
jgi:hypothetical protein